MSTDRRIRRTENLLFDALTALLHEKPITKITVKELCEKADINRGTFYAHYADQYALLDSIIEKVSKGIRAFFTDSDSARSEVEVYKKLLTVFHYVRNNSELCSVLLSTNTKVDFSDLVINFMMEENFFNLSSFSINSERAMKYVCSFIAMGAIGLIRDWLEYGMVESNEEMARLLLNLVNEGTKDMHD